MYQKKLLAVLCFSLVCLVVSIGFPNVLEPMHNDAIKLLSGFFLTSFLLSAVLLQRSRRR